MAAREMTVVCAWCHRVVKAGGAGAAVTHTICASCVAWTFDHPTVEPGDAMPCTAHDLEDLRPPAGARATRAFTIGSASRRSRTAAPCN